MGKKLIKITEAQADMLKGMGKPKVLKVTQEQYNRILEMEKVQEIEFQENDMNDLLIVKDNDEYILVNKNNKAIEAKIAPAKFVTDKKRLCDMAMNTFNELFENRGVSEAVYQGGEENIIGPLTACKVDMSEEQQSKMTRELIHQSPSQNRPEMTRQLNKANIKKVDEMYESFLRELYGLTESKSTVYEKLHKLMEVGGLVEGNRLVKEKFGNDKERAKACISAGLHEMACGGSAYRAMEAIEEALELKDITPDYFRKQIGEPKKSGKSKEELMAAIKKQREKSHAITAQKEKEREDAIKALAQGEQDQKLEEYSDNLPAGAEYDSRAPWNQQDPRGKRAKKYLYDLIGVEDDDAFFKDAKGNEFIYRIPDENGSYSDYQDYADIEMVTDGPDEDGDYSEYPADDTWYYDSDVLGNAVEEYVNDNLKYIKVVTSDTYNAYNANPQTLILIDDELKSEFDLDEETGASSSGAYTGKLGGIPVKRKFQPTDIDLDEETSTATAGNYQYDANAFKAGGDVDMTGKDNEYKRLKEGEGETRYVAEMDFYLWATDDEHAKQVAQSMAQEMDSKYDNQPRIQKLFRQPFGTMGSQEIPMNEDSHSNTQWKGGSFVKTPECAKLNNNKEAQNGGCNSGDINNIKLTKTKDAIISNDHIVQEVAKKTGRSIEEVRKIISNFK